MIWFLQSDWFRKGRAAMRRKGVVEDGGGDIRRDRVSVGGQKGQFRHQNNDKNGVQHCNGLHSKAWSPGHCPAGRREVETDDNLTGFGRVVRDTEPTGRKFTGTGC